MSWARILLKQPVQSSPEESGVKMENELNLMHTEKYYSSLPHLRKVLASRGRQMAFNAENIEEYNEWKTALKARLTELLGLNLMEKVPLIPECESVEQMDGYRREKWIIRTEPDVFMPFYILIPDSVKEGDRNPCIIAPHGHSTGGKYSIAGRVDIPVVEKEVIRCNEAYGVEFVKRGYTVFCPDARGFGERRESGMQGDDEFKFMHSSCEQLNHMAIPLGLNVCGMWVWDLMRLTDYIQSRDDCDPGRIACGGLSGGGFQTLYFTAMDERIKCGVSSGYFYGIEDSLLVMSLNCSCNYVPHMWETCDMGDIGALIAPRPFLVESGLKDHLSGERGIENVREQVEITAKAYRLFGAGDKLVLYTFDGPHVWNGAATYDFIARYL